MVEEKEMSECDIGEIQETGPHEITIWHSGMEPQWMIDVIIKNEQIVKRLKEFYNDEELLLKSIVESDKSGSDQHLQVLNLTIKIKKILDGEK